MHGGFMRDPAHTKSVGLLLAGAVCWSLAGVLFKYVEWPGLAAAGGRGLIAALFLLAVTFRSLRFTWSPLQLAAAVAYAACTVLFTLANKMTTAANAILLQYTAPVWIALLGAWFLGERATRADWLTIAAVFGGLALFFYEGLQLNNVAGLLVAVASGVAFAVMTLLMRKQKDTSALESIILGNLLGFVIGLPALWTAPALPATGWIALLLLGLVQLGLAYLFYAKAIKHVTALEAVLIPVMEPLLNPLWVLLAFHERPGRFALLGGAIVLGAVTLRAVSGLRAPRPAA
ncbi:EamA-like transporter family protein [Lacunisphaera limnophila]|uniref:EamA-like transporter family protein n=2 Tax=Lacunisphaera limnophila TaxID=1838286 RepID=A0A1D8AU92_9BACT|nr:EamA-like transporter family protein [Lacunisphaera limnophila]